MFAQTVIPNARAFVFGSSANGFGTKSSDMDVTLITPSHPHYDKLSKYAALVYSEAPAVRVAEQEAVAATAAPTQPSTEPAALSSHGLICQSNVLISYY